MNNMVQLHYIYHALYLNYYYIAIYNEVIAPHNRESYHQALGSHKEQAT